MCSTSMNLFSRTLVWLLVLAIPVQGFAASALHFCGPDGHGLREAAGQQAEGVGDTDFGRNDSSSGDRHSGNTQHEHGSASSALASLAAIDGASKHEGALPDESHVLLRSGAIHCSACADCCSGVAVLGMTLPTLAVETSVEPATSAAPPVFGYITDGPDRPPQIVLA